MGLNFKLVYIWFLFGYDFEICLILWLLFVIIEKIMGFKNEFIFDKGFCLLNVLFEMFFKFS